jgi:hypothetical protein
MNRVTTTKPSRQLGPKSKATAKRQARQGNLSWYSSVPGAGTHLTLSRQSAPKSMVRGWLSLRTRVWLASWRETTGPGLRPRVWAQDEVVASGDNRVFGPRRSWGWFKPSHGFTSQNKGIGPLVAQGSPENANRAPDRGDTGDAHGLGLLETVVVSPQGRLMQDQAIKQIVEGAAQINVAGFDDCFTLALALPGAGIIPAADQAGTTKELAGTAIVGRVAGGSGQAGHAQGRQPFELGQKLVGGLGQRLAQLLAVKVNTGGYLVQGLQISGQQLAANRHHLRVWPEYLLGVSNDAAGSTRSHPATTLMKQGHQVGGRKGGQLARVWTNTDQVLQRLALPRSRCGTRGCSVLLSPPWSESALGKCGPNGQ